MCLSVVLCLVFGNHQRLSNYGILQVFVITEVMSPESYTLFVLLVSRT